MILKHQNRPAPITDYLKIPNKKTADFKSVKVNLRIDYCFNMKAKVENFGQVNQLQT